MSFIKKVNPAGAIGDFLTVWQSAGRNRYWLLFAACIPTLLLLTLFYNDIRSKNVPPETQIIYVESWPADRSREDILADQAERQKLRAEQEAQMKENYKALGRAVGMDVERIEREAEAEKAAEEARKAEAAKTATDETGSEAASSAATEPARTGG